MDRAHFAGLDDEAKPLRHSDCAAGCCTACDEEERAADEAEHYSITIGDRAGHFASCEVVGLDAACKRTRELARRYPSKAFAFANIDHCDGDTDGLSNDEHEALYEAVFAGRADAKPSSDWHRCSRCLKKVYAPETRCPCGGELWGVKYARSTEAA